MKTTVIRNSYNSKAQRLTESIRSDLTGVFDRETFLPTEEQLAIHYTSSRNTIRRALENLTADGVLERERNRRLRIRRETLASGKPKEKVFTLVWAFAAQQDALICSFTDGISQYVKEHRQKLQIIGNANGHESMLNAVLNCSRLGCDGVILLPCGLPEYRKLLEQLVAEDFPVVITGCAIPGLPVSSVGSDNFGGVYSASRRLIQRCGGPVYFIAASDQQDGVERYRAWRKAMTDTGFEALVEEYCCDLGVSGTEPGHWSMTEKFTHPLPVLEEFFSRVSPPAGVMCVNDYLAHCVYQCAARRGWQIPRDIRVIGFDDIPVARRMDPPLTTIRSDIWQSGYCAARILHRRLTGEVPEAVHLTIPTEFIERGSD